MNMKTSRDVLDDALRARLRDDVDLLPQIAAQFAQGKSPMRTSTQWLVGAALALIIFTLAFFTFPGVALAVQNLLRYIPGFGVVDTSVGIRKLAEPVSLTRDGITVLVDDATLTGDSTLIHVAVSGLSAALYPPADEIVRPDALCDAPVFLRLDDGKTIEIDYSAAGNAFHFVGPAVGDESYQNDWSLLPMPIGMKTATLVMPCVLSLKHGAAPENWELPLRFAPQGAVGTRVRPTASLTPKATETAPVETATATRIRPSLTPTRTPFIRVLAQPVSQTRDGITLSVIKATLDDDLTVIEVSASGVANKAYPTPSGDFSAVCSSGGQLLLPDGTHTDPHIVPGADGLYLANPPEILSFWFLPKNVNNVTLLLGCVPGMETNSAPQDWEIPLRFVPLVSKPIPSATPKAAVVEPPSGVKKLTQCEKNCSGPSWSADGRYVAYQTGNGSSLHVMDSDGKNDHLLAATSRQMAWSPTGAQLAIISAAKLFVVNADGSGLVTLSEQAGYWQAPVWSADGRQIAFVATQDQQSLLATIGVDGTGLRSRYLSRRDDVIIDEQINELTWLPDGSKLAFSSVISRPADPLTFEIRLLDLADDTLDVLYHVEEEIQFSLLGTSADGRQIYMLDYHKPKQVLYQINLDGSGTTQLATLPEEYQGMKISPDHKRLVYITKDGNLDMVEFADGKRRTLVKKVAFALDNWLSESVHLVFRPNGEQIVFTAQDRSIYMVDLDGSNLIKISPGDFPVWSPDGAHLLLVAPSQNGTEAEAVTQIYSLDSPR